MLTVYEHIESPCCQKVRLMLAEKQISFEPIFIDTQRGVQFEDWYLAINPKAQVPVLVHEADDEKIILTESTVICEYLEEFFPEKPMFPAKLSERALARSWVSLVDLGIHVPHTAALTFTIAFRDELLAEFDTPEKQEAYLAGIGSLSNRGARRETLELGFEAPSFIEALKAYDQMFQMMQTQLEKTRWLAGDDFSYADMVIVPYIKRALLLDLREMIAPYSAILPWYETVTQRESWQINIAGNDSKYVAMFNECSKGAWEKVEPILSGGTSPVRTKLDIVSITAV